MMKSHPLAMRRFIHIPGPNPILKRGAPGKWDDGCLEAGDIFKDFSDGREIYYFYYHAFPDKRRSDAGYSIGVAMSDGPLGPFKKYEGNPILKADPEKSWEDIYVACPTILKQGPANYLMFYYGRGTVNGRIGNVSLATASHPLGPWTKYEENPVRPDFGYVSGVVHVDGLYYMYAEHPIDSTGQDYGSLSLATATDPHGPWTLHHENPVLSPPGWGSWDDGGYSEAKFVYHDGFFHTFYGGAKLQPNRRRSLESIGYAFSEDGIHFTKHHDNPVAPRERNPDASAFAEVQCLFEPPFVYLYHTLRYLSVSDEDMLIEDLGVQVLVTDSPYKLSMPVLELERLTAGGSSGLDECPPVNLERVRRILVTVEARYPETIASPLRIIMRRSHNGTDFDTEDWESFDHKLIPRGASRGATLRTSRGATLRTSRSTYEFKADAAFVKFLVKNQDDAAAVDHVLVTVTLLG